MHKILLVYLHTLSINRPAHLEDICQRNAFSTSNCVICNCHCSLGVVESPSFLIVWRPYWAGEAQPGCRLKHWNYFCVQFSAISEKALLVGSSPGFIHFSFWWDKPVDEDEYGTLVEWYWEEKTDVRAEKPFARTSSTIISNGLAQDWTCDSLLISLQTTAFKDGK